MTGVCCGIDEAIRHILEDCSEFLWADPVINLLDYHRAQAEGVKPKYHKMDVIKDYYTCRNCGYRVLIQDNYCPNCKHYSYIAWLFFPHFCGYWIEQIPERYLLGVCAAYEPRRGYNVRNKRTNEQSTI